ncbi:hypothetical protein [Actinacidiphila sp. bgisy160]|uniref:hypothetical protein n=1 Tax=Actinacidiphila sp. bgisy160 TaxID=3413796 RepID=UPI003D7653D8
MAYKKQQERETRRQQAAAERWSARLNAAETPWDRVAVTYDRIRAQVAKLPPEKRDRAAAAVERALQTATAEFLGG